MAKYNNSVLTTAGLALANRAAKGVTKFKITKVTSTADVVVDSAIAALTKLPNEVQVGTITGEQPLPDGDGTITGTKVLFVNHKLQTSYKINAVGVYAVEEGGDEFLYAVITAVEPEFMPDFSDQVLMEFGMTIYIVVGQVESMSIVVAPGSFATVAYVDKAIADHQVVFPKTLTYSDRNEVITGAWQFKNGAVNGDGNKFLTEPDTSGWQKTKITADDGGYSLRMYASKDSDINVTLSGLPAGVHTIYVQMGTKNNPSTDSLRGIVTKSEPDFGNGIFMSNAAGGYAMWEMNIENGNVRWERMVTTTDVAPFTTGTWVATGTDLDSLRAMGVYLLAGTAPLHMPSGLTGNQWQILHVTSDGGPGASNGAQMLQDTNSSRMWTRGWNMSGGKMVFTDWTEMASVTSLENNGILYQRTLTANDDVLNLEDGTYYYQGVTPKNLPAGVDPQWGKVVATSWNGGNEKQVDIYSLTGSHYYSIYSGGNPQWGGWKHFVTGNTNGTITVNGQTYTPLTKENDLQTIYNQVQTMINAEFTKRNAPSHWYTGLTQAQYNAIVTKDTTAEYDINE